MYEIKKTKFMATLFAGALLWFSMVAIADSSQGSDDETSDGGAQDDGDGGTQSDHAEDYIESWIYISVPDRGTYSLREVLNEGTAGFEAFAIAGYPLGDYEPTQIFATNATLDGSGIVMLMLAQHCLGDMNDDGLVNAGDIALFTQAYLAGDLAADLTGNGVVDIFDQLFFIELASMGCVVI